MRRALLLAGASLLLGVVAARAQPAEQRITVELNRLGPGQNGCQVYMIGRNGTEQAFTTLQTDLVTFGPDGVVNGRLLVELGPLAAGKTVLRLFELPELSCESIQRVLLNEVPRCETEGGAVEGCTAMIEPASRTQAEFFK